MSKRNIFTAEYFAEGTTNFSLLMKTAEEYDTHVGECKISPKDLAVLFFDGVADGKINSHSFNYLVIGNQITEEEERHPDRIKKVRFMLADSSEYMNDIYHDIVNTEQRLLVDTKNKINHKHQQKDSILGFTSRNDPKYNFDGRKYLLTTIANETINDYLKVDKNFLLDYYGLHSAFYLKNKLAKKDRIGIVYICKDVNKEEENHFYSIIGFTGSSEFQLIKYSEIVKRAEALISKGCNLLNWSISHEKISIDLSIPNINGNADNSFIRLESSNTGYGAPRLYLYHRYKFEHSTLNFKCGEFAIPDDDSKLDVDLYLSELNKNLKKYKEITDGVKFNAKSVLRESSNGKVKKAILGLKTFKRFDSIRREYANVPMSEFLLMGPILFERYTKIEEQMDDSMKFCLNLISESEKSIWQDYLFRKVVEYETPNSKRLS